MNEFIEELNVLIQPFLPGIEQSYFSILIFTGGMALYSILIYFFYQFVAKRDVFVLDIEKYKVEKPHGILQKLGNFLVEVFRYGLIFPLFVFVWFAGFSVLLFFLNKAQPTEEVLLVAIALVSTVRFTAYVREKLAQDLAKMLPLVLLATAMVEPGFFSLELAEERIQELPDLIKQAVQLVSFTILLEWILRILLAIKQAIFKSEEHFEVAGYTKKKITPKTEK